MLGVRTAVRSCSVPTGPATSSCGGCRRAAATRCSSRGKADLRRGFRRTGSISTTSSRAPPADCAASLWAVGPEEDVLPSVRDRNWAVTADGIYVFQMRTGGTGLYGINQPAELLFYDFGRNASEHDGLHDAAAHRQQRRDRLRPTASAWSFRNWTNWAATSCWWSTSAER